MEPAELRIAVAGGHLAARDHGGSGHHVLLVHDVGDNAAQWDRLAPLLTPYAHVVSFDLRGHGQTTAALTGLDQIADDVVAFAAHCGVERFVLVGHQWGGDVVALVAERHPELVAALCTIDAPINLPRDQYHQLVEYVAQSSVIDSLVARLSLGRTGLGEVQLGNFIDATAAVIANDWLNPPMTAEEAVAGVARSIHHGPGLLWARVPTRETVVAYTRGAMRGRLQALSDFVDRPWPVWILQPSEGDYSAAFDSLASLAARQPGWVAELLPGGTHCIFTHPLEVSDILSDLLRGLPPE